MLLAQKMHFFLYLLFVKTRLEIILNAFAKKKEIFFDYNDKNVSKTFSKGLIKTLAKKMQFPS